MIVFACLPKKSIKRKKNKTIFGSLRLKEITLQRIGDPKKGDGPFFAGGKAVWVGEYDHSSTLADGGAYPKKG